MDRLKTVRFWIHLMVVCIFSVNLLTSPGAALASSSMDDQPLPARSDQPALSTQLPNDTVSAVHVLVETIFGIDEFQASLAVGELLRRAGLPLVSIAGPVTGIPDSLVLVDAPIYTELIPDLTRALRRGSFYTPEQLVILLQEVGFNSEPLDPHVMVAALGEWGKSPGSRSESLVAGSTVRALAGRRLQVLYDGVDLDSIQFDPLQVMLVLAHATSRADPVVKPTSWITPPLTLFEHFMGVQSVAYAASGPCDALSKLTKRESQDQAQSRGVLQEGLKNSWMEFIKSGSETASQALETGFTYKDRGTAVLSTLLLLMGATIEVKPDKSATHFGHGGSASNQHVKVEAIARFDSAIAEQYVACYGLAGVDVPPSGRMEGFRIRWYMYQSKGGPAGSFLQPISADINKLSRGGGGGEVTGINGNSILELTPPVEETDPPVGALGNGIVQVTASLDKDNFPVGLSDLLGLGNPAGFVISETWALAIGAIQKAGLPSQSVNINVGYHGADIYISKGETFLWLIYWNGPVKMDIYTCQGLAGLWTGHGGVGGLKEGGWGFLAEIVVGDIIPNTIADTSGEFQFMIDPNSTENTFDIVPGSITGVMRTRILTNSNANIIINRRLARMVGDVEMKIGNIPLSVLSFGTGTVFPLYWVPEDPRCPAGGAHYEN